MGAGLTGALDQYNQLLDRQPYVTNSATAGFLAAFTACLKHRLSNQGGTFDTSDFWRRFVLGFALVGPLATTNIRFLERIFISWEGAKFTTVAAKAFVEQLTYSPLINGLYIFWVGILQGRTLSQAYKDVRTDLMDVWRADNICWIPANLISYRFVPVKFRVLFSRIVSILWYLYVFHKTSKQKGKAVGSKHASDNQM
eukprot:gnl/MRDRNA2_/MRDRNA2_30362_c0_seq1.p1 gnl/MRDRNA2_/MRDRNA2_30362_c0~~gnl/MRDRNA2_/MRDRNA2_30362_c0_seq1.p1  ORF type:complete len:198 (+),score=20.06 gnl/MRDRNA2_/MRDRNA2_30362_c0_seq1:146-739(+)